jgi:hypothetical protein
VAHGHYIFLLFHLSFFALSIFMNILLFLILVLGISHDID